MTCRLNFLYSYFLLWEHALRSEVPSRIFALCNLLGPPSLNSYVRIFPSIYTYSLPEFFRHQESNPRHQESSPRHKERNPRHQESWIKGLGNKRKALLVYSQFDSICLYLKAFWQNNTQTGMIPDVGHHITRQRQTVTVWIRLLHVRKRNMGFEEQHKGRQISRLSFNTFLDITGMIRVVLIQNIHFIYVSRCQFEFHIQK